MKDAIKKAAVRSLAAKAFAKKAPLLGAIIASEDVLKKIGAAGNDYMSGHKAGAKNELQQAVTHAVGAAVNFIGSVSIIGMTAGMVAQYMAQKHAESIAAQKPPHPDINPTMYGKVVKRAKAVVKTAQAVRTVAEAGVEVARMAKLTPLTKSTKTQKATTAAAATTIPKTTAAAKSAKAAPAKSRAPRKKLPAQA